MIREQGTIRKIRNSKAVVKVQQTSACAHCTSRGSCEVSKREMLIEVPNDLRAKEGDLVELSVPEGTVIKLSLLVYFVPVIALLIGAFSGSLIAKTLQTNSSLPAVLGGVLLMVLVFYGLRRFERKKQSEKKAYFPRMTRILTHATSPRPGDGT